MSLFIVVVVPLSDCSLLSILVLQQRLFRLLTFLKSKNKDFDEDEKQFAQEIALLKSDQGKARIPIRRHQIEPASGEGSQISTGFD